ncbi:hypothetical protein FNV43_RR02603 [Rhamnella rubrinervis]|uniref:Gamma tubulin complex component protein N-terminal domain-containing protein n=1 Tax=Rhamnella rubrinervis TaxID=2594499 RepID=A0A8K0MTC7_9ROSA|nr:hypothetical protein FNV43_RR02603 [Rhamnella rubrinervis]
MVKSLIRLCWLMRWCSCCSLLTHNSDLIKKLVLRLLSRNPNSDSQQPTNSNSPAFHNYLRYTIRILSSQLTPSVTLDSAAIAKCIKHRLATQDQKTIKSQLDYLILLPNLELKGAELGNILPVLYGRGKQEKGWNNGVLLIAKDPENIRDIAFKEFVPKATRIMVRKLCELRWLFRKVKGYISESMSQFPAEDIGTVSQAFYVVLQYELSEYYKLLGVLEAQLMESNSFSFKFGNFRQLSFVEEIIYLVY